MAVDEATNDKHLIPIPKIENRICVLNSEKASLNQPGDYVKLSLTKRKLEGKISLITGAGSGVGKAMAKLFSDNGSKVIVVDIISERVSQVVEDIGNSNAIGMVCDLSQKSEVERMVDGAIASQGRIDILCNNAGVMDGMMPVAEVSDELWQRVLNINLNAPFWAIRKVIPKMVEKGSGVIINTASVAGFFAGKSGTSYTVSKHALIGLTKSTAVFYGNKGIRCNAMVLGAVETAIGLGSATPSSAGMEVLKKGMAALPRVANPTEVANLALFLASDDSSYVNGSCIIIDGGWTAF
jgi:NAD(P)-dependent dehydrogenase (short-subunit alcohol dehydrogenase family)